MKEFVEKQTDRVEEKIKVTSLEIIVTGTKDKPYFEIKYKEVGKEGYNIGFSSYDLNNVLGWKEECFEIINKLAEEYNSGWIPCSERLPEDFISCWVTIHDTESGNYYVRKIKWDAHFKEWLWNNGKSLFNTAVVVAWKEFVIPKPYQSKEQ